MNKEENKPINPPIISLITNIPKRDVVNINKLWFDILNNVDSFDINILLYYYILNILFIVILKLFLFEFFSL